MQAVLGNAAIGLEDGVTKLREIDLHESGPSLARLDLRDMEDGIEC
jgi:hypothetical protein